MLKKQLAWYLALNRNSLVEGCYDDVDDRRGRRERKKEKRKNRWKRGRGKKTCVSLSWYIIFSHQNVNSV